MEVSVFCTDSTAVLKYLNNEDKRFHVFVANRIATSRETVEPSWRDVSSKEIPADDGSRGMKVGNFLKLAIIRNFLSDYCQQKKFSEEISALSSGKVSVNQQSPIFRSDPFLDDGLLRVGGRLNKAAMPEEVKHPLTLSKDQHISMLILKHIHESLSHGG